jgi:hypothetical protein
MSDGDSITIAIQAKLGKEEWKPIERQTLRIDDTAQNRKAFHIGRRVSIEMKPL